MNHQDTKTPSINNITPKIDVVAREVVDAAYKVHSSLGPGLLENVYEVCLAHELKKKGLKVESQKPLPVLYDNLRLEAGFRLDLLVDDCVVVELKAVEFLLPVHQAQLMTYLKLSGYHLGLVINFNVAAIKQGIKRIVL